MSIDPWPEEDHLGDPFPYRVGSVRLAYPGWLNGQHTIHDPRPETER